MGRDFLRDHQVKFGLGFAGVGDGAGADFEIALRRRQLFANRRFLRADKGQTVARRQHIKVRAAYPHHQVLARGGQSQFHHGCVALGGGHRELVEAAVQGLAECQAQRAVGSCCLGGVVGAICGRLGLLPALGQRALQADHRRVLRLHLFGLCRYRIQLRLGRLVAGVIALGSLVHLQQALGLGVERQPQAHECDTQPMVQG